eukprot:TRINITY_DN3198_c0_g1_i2.p1 TRINITY_DN3198_c0_g1~~TRINITY_DN3198_c0_g1_i2.p1  ORF type:complete len:552 (-),score=114.58 TRINITY_DN3198_c0_g1_i2:49-1704(-)
MQPFRSLVPRTWRKGGTKPPKDAAARALLAGVAFPDVSDPQVGHGPLPEHPEAPDRVAGCVARLQSRGELWRSLKKLQRRRATDEELQLCHDESYILGLEKLAKVAAAEGRPHYVPAHDLVCLSQVHSDEEEDTFVTGGSLEAARFSVGGLLEMVDEVLASKGPSCGLALCRPPGHHASRNRSSGFCLVNNVAVAATYARSRYPDVKRVLIFDWDVHHGQGTQQIFEQSCDVLFVSFHRHDGHIFYPCTGSPTEVGCGAGRGYTVNVALPEGFGDAALWAACSQVLLPASRSFRPDLIIISAGFDAASGDPIGGCGVAPKAFGLLTRELRRLAAEHAHGRLLFALEGGYNVEVLADCVEEVMLELVAEEPTGDADPFSDAPLWLEGSPCQGAIRKTCELHKGPPLRLPLPESKKERRRGASRSAASLKAPCSLLEAQDTAEAGPRSKGSEAEKPPDAPSARIEVGTGEIQVRIQASQRPEDIIVSSRELWVWLCSGSRGTEPTLWRWCFEGVLVDPAGSCGKAKFSSSRRELTLRLSLGPILGGAVALRLQ